MKQSYTITVDADDIEDEETQLHLLERAERRLEGILGIRVEFREITRPKKAAPKDTVDNMKPLTLD